MTPLYLQHLTQDGTLVDGSVGLSTAEARDEHKVQKAMQRMMVAAWRIQQFARRQWRRRFNTFYCENPGHAPTGDVETTTSETDEVSNSKPFEQFRSEVAAHGTIAKFPKPVVLAGISTAHESVTTARDLLRVLKEKENEYRDQYDETHFRTARYIQRIFRGHITRRRFQAEQAGRLQRERNERIRRQVKTGFHLSPAERYALQQQVRAEDGVKPRQKHPREVINPDRTVMLARQLAKSVDGVSLEHAKTALQKNGGHYASALMELRRERKAKLEEEQRMADHVANQRRMKSQAALYGR